MLFALLLAIPLFAADRFGDVEITTFIHSSIQIEHAGKVIQVDPWSLADLSRAKPADLILITDDVGHHLDVKAIARLRKAGAPVVIAANGRQQVPDGVIMNNGDTMTFGGITVDAIGAYDIKPGEPYHPKGEANGYVIAVGGKRIYVVGVTECVPEVKAVKNVDVAFFPVNLPLARMEPAAAMPRNPGQSTPARGAGRDCPEAVAAAQSTITPHRSTAAPEHLSTFIWDTTPQGERRCSWPSVPSSVPAALASSASASRRQSARGAPTPDRSDTDTPPSVPSR